MSRFVVPEYMRRGGKLFRALRHARNVNTSKACKEAGVSNSTITSLEIGRRGASRAILISIISRMDLTEEEKTLVLMSFGYVSDEMILTAQLKLAMKIRDML